MLHLRITISIAIRTRWFTRPCRYRADWVVTSSAMDQHQIELKIYTIVHGPQASLSLVIKHRHNKQLAPKGFNANVLYSS